LALIRSVPWAGSAYRITIFPFSFRSSSPSAPRTSGVVVNLVDNNNKEVLDLVPTSVGVLRAHGIALLQDACDGRPTGLTIQDGAIIVPDGVAKVTVRTAISKCSRNELPDARGFPVHENVTAAVHDNVAIVPLRTPTFKNINGFGFGGASVLRVTWLDAHDNMIKHTTTAFALADVGPGSGWPQ
jgi:hypothetical protein